VVLVPPSCHVLLPSTSRGNGGDGGNGGIGGIAGNVNGEAIDAKSPASTAQLEFLGTSGAAGNPGAPGAGGATGFAGFAGYGGTNGDQSLAPNGKEGDAGSVGQTQIQGAKGNDTGDKAGFIEAGTFLSLKTKTLPDGKKLKRYAAKLELSGKKHVAARWEAFGLPPGITLSASGKLSGKPTVAGRFTVAFVFAAKRGSEMGSATLTLKVSK
jgi:hypothetical protein